MTSQEIPFAFEYTTKNAVRYNEVTTDGNAVERLLP